MALTKRNVFTILSAIYLLTLLLIASFSLHKIRTLSLPIPHILAAFTLALPPVAGLTLETLTSLPTSTKPILKISGQRQKHPSRWPNISILALFIYETVLATLIGTYLASTDCALDEKWGTMFHRHDANAIQRIQDTFACCGLHSQLDRAYPFPRKDVGVDTCQRTLGRHKACFSSWRGEERQIAALMMAVVLFVAIWKIIILLVPASRGSWFARFSQSRAEQDEEEGQTGGRRALDYQSGEGRYLDGPSATAEEVDGSEEGGDGTVAPVNSRVQPSQLRGDSEQWADERAS